MIGISVGFSFEWPFCRDLAGLIRRRFPKALIVAGGEHVTAVPGRSLEESTIDVGILGEGEETTLAVAKALAGAYDLAIWAFSPYPGSEMLSQIAGSRRIRLDDAYDDSLRSYADTTRTVSYGEHFSNRALKALRWIGTALFYGTSWLRRPARPFKMAWNILYGRQESRSEMALANVIYRDKLKTFSAEADGRGA